MTTTKDISDKELRKFFIYTMCEHFNLEEGFFTSRREDALVGDRRFGFVTYNVAGLDISLLTGTHPNYAVYAGACEALRRDGKNACFVELAGQGFTMGGIMTITRESRLDPKGLTTDTTIGLHAFELKGSAKRAMAFFTFAKLAK